MGDKGGKKNKAKKQRQSQDKQKQKQENKFEKQPKVTLISGKEWNSPFYATYISRLDIIEQQLFGTQLLTWSKITPKSSSQDVDENGFPPAGLF